MANVKTENNAQARLLAEANQISYRLRSTFFYRKMKEYDVLALPSIIARLSRIEGLYNWDDRVNWGISEDAYIYIDKHPNLKLIQVFCHPKLLREYPTLLAYYLIIRVMEKEFVEFPEPEQHRGQRAIPTTEESALVRA